MNIVRQKFLKDEKKIQMHDREEEGFWNIILFVVYITSISRL